jgi:Activator of Hsp90 ATPase homolog 1-like protein.
MEKHDWSKFSLKINIDADVEDIFNAWSIPGELEKWFLRSAKFQHNGAELSKNARVQDGDAYEWLWHGHPDTSIEKGTIRHTNGVDTIGFDFSGGAYVTVEIADVGGECICMLTQEDIPTDEHGMVNYNMGCQVGWTFYLTNLKSHLEGGIDLRNKNMRFAGVVNS